MSNGPAIKVENVSKKFKLPHEKNTSIKSAVINFYKKNKGFEVQSALKDVSFTVEKGEFFGIIGRNGSGKSTLLKILAGIYHPTNGNVQINGKLTPFIELGVGFNPELTGRENVFLNGALLGFNRSEMSAMYEEIVEFAELEKFMDQKLKNYSSGMQVRLAFSIAIRAKSDILLIDEVLAVGDTNFQKKCFEVFAEFKKEKRTVILVTHDMSSVEQYCDRAMLINYGDVLNVGNVNEVVKQYNEINTQALIKSSDNKSSTYKSSADSSKAAQIVECNVFNAKDSRAYVFKPEDQIGVRLKVKINKPIDELIAGITMYDQLNHPLFAINTEAKKVNINTTKPGDLLEVEFTIDNVLSDGTYYISPELSSDSGRTVHDNLEEPLQFKTAGWAYPAYLLQPKNDIKILKSKKDNSSER